MERIVFCEDKWVVGLDVKLSAMSREEKREEADYGGAGW